MKSITRRSWLAAALLALPLAGASLLGQAAPEQRGGPPNANTPYILITAFHSNDRQLGVEIGDELRRRLQQDHSANELFVIPRRTIANSLAAAGRSIDSALTVYDLVELAKSLRGDQVVEGTANTVAHGIQVDTRVLIRAGQSVLTQPLPRVTAADTADAAKLVERALDDALPSIPAFRTCMTDIRVSKYDDAIAAGRQGIAAYPRSTFARICILEAYEAQKAPVDSIIAVASAIRVIDSTSAIALETLEDAYSAKHDTVNAISVSLAMYRLGLTSPNGMQTIPPPGGIADGTGPSPDVAIRIVDSLIAQSPVDVSLRRTKWLLQLRAKRYKAALATGAEMVKMDTSKANLDYFQRSIAAAGLDSNYATQEQLIRQAMQKFGNKVPVEFPLALASHYYKAGQLQEALGMARRAIEIDPKNNFAWRIQILSQNAMNQCDSAIATARKAIAAGVPRDTLRAEQLQVSCKP